MSVLDKIMFWKHDDLGKERELGLDKEMDLGKERDLGLPEPEPAGLAPREIMPETPIPADPGITAPTPSAFQEQRVDTQNKEIELISAKMDALKATLDSINQRLENIERMAKQ